MIKVRNLQKSFGDLQVLKGIDYDIKEKDTLCIIGPSGSGKSTFLRCINLMEEPTGGHIFIKGKDILAKDRPCGDEAKGGDGVSAFQPFPASDGFGQCYFGSAQGEEDGQTKAESLALDLLGAKRQERWACPHNHLNLFLKSPKVAKPDTT